ncbi:hypothetical protein DBV15_10278 [Temnothorax longispinosus]|uniref:Uncharacterized protein n=1 Tax=Temnothorax longispinosus TaxID=300112 RepID=A0A4S2KUA6_9HYME|nr:hypothetical protein DBV15_10278 [Temnothorax longispinosus]
MEITHHRARFAPVNPPSSPCSFAYRAMNSHGCNAAEQQEKKLQHLQPRCRRQRRTRGQESLAARPCLRLFVHVASGIAHTRTCTPRTLSTPRTTAACMYESYESVPAPYFWDKELCKHEFTSGGHYCPGPGASYPSGTSLVQSFLLVTLPVTSTSMRYDRYDTCLHVCLRTYAVLVHYARMLREQRRTGRPARFRARCEARLRLSSARELFFTVFHGRAKLQAVDHHSPQFSSIINASAMHNAFIAFCRRFATTAHVTCINTGAAEKCARDDVILSIIKRIICARSHCPVPCASSHTGNLGMHRMHEFMIARKSGMFGTEVPLRETNFMERLQPTPRKYRCGFLEIRSYTEGEFFFPTGFDFRQRKTAEKRNRERVDLSQNVGRIERKSPAGSVHGTTIRHRPPPRVPNGREGVQRESRGCNNSETVTVNTLDRLMRGVVPCKWEASLGVGDACPGEMQEAQEIKKRSSKHQARFDVKADSQAYPNIMLHELLNFPKLEDATPGRHWLHRIVGTLVVYRERAPKGGAEKVGETSRHAAIIYIYNRHSETTIATVTFVYCETYRFTFA